MKEKIEANGSSHALSLEKKLALYGLAGSALLAMPAAAQADVIYSGILNYTTGVTRGGFVSDAVVFGLTDSTLELGWAGDSTDLNPSMVTLLSWTTGNAYVAGDNSSGYASVVSTASIIGDTTDWISSSVPVLTKTSDSDTIGNWATDGTAAYSGLKFTSSGNSYYGWAQIGVDTDSDKVTITLIDWAYNDVAGESIKAGQTTSSTPVPEPSTLALFALGAAGLGMMRRYRKQDSAEA